MGRTGNHGHRIPRGLVFEVRHVPPKFPAPRLRDLCEHAQGFHHPAGVLSSVAQLTPAKSTSSRRLRIERLCARPNVFVWLTNYQNYLTTTTRSSRTSTRERWRSITASIIRLTSPILTTRSKAKATWKRNRSKT